MTSSPRVRNFHWLALMVAFVMAAVMTIGIASGDPSSFRSPEVLNTRAVFSKPCSKIIYSSNRDGVVRPFVVDMKNPAQPKVSEIAISEPEDFVAQALSPDCKTLAIVADHHGDTVFDIYLYNLENRSLTKITDTPGIDNGKPAFAPHGHVLAYLTNGRLALYDYAAGKRLPMAPTFSRSQSILWAQDGESIYLDSDSTGIRQYDLKTSHVSKVWTPPTPGYSSHLLAEHDGRLLFVSSHETETRQIYQLDPRDGSVKRLYPSDHDQFSPLEVGKGRYLFRTNLDGNFIAAQLRDGKLSTLSPPTGVVYDFSIDFGAPLLLYSNDQLPIGFYWFKDGHLRPLLPAASDLSHQPVAIPIKNADGMTNFLYLPSSKPRAWLIWLHGGPSEQVSPRYNLYFDFLARKNIAVYALNYPGSTGMGKTYELRTKRPDEKFAVEMSAIERDLAQLRQLYPEAVPSMMVGVSYGAILGHRMLPQHPQVTRFVDFSGIADTQLVADPGPTFTYPTTLFIYGDNDPNLRNGPRRDLIARCENHSKVTRLTVPNEGHYIQRRDSVDRILEAMDQFLAAQASPAGAPKASPGS